jgi:HK97 family phage prohead protease
MPRDVRSDDLDYLSVELKAEDVDVNVRRREIWALASTPAPDAQGDAVLPEAFARTLREKQPGEIPVFWRHDYSQLPLGRPVKLEADARGLMTITRTFKTARGDELLAMAAELLEGGTPLGVSVGFKTRAADYRKVGDKTVRCIRDLDLAEYSFTPPNGQANRGAVVLSVKSLTAWPAPVRSRDELLAVLGELDEALAGFDRAEQDEYVAMQAKTREYRQALDALDRWSWLHGGPDPRQAEQAKLARDVERRVQAELREQREAIEAKARAEAESRQAREWWERNLHGENPF